MDWEQAKPLLEQKLDTNNVKAASTDFNGPKGDYLEGWHVISEANRIFGFNGWSYEILSLKQACEVTQNAKGNNVVAYICTISVLVDGVTRQDVGYGSGISKNLGDAHEGATKEAVTDALKRALRTFGNQFGLALYDKEKRNIEDPKQAQKERAGSLSAELKAIGTVEGIKSFWADNVDEIKTFPQVTQDYLQQVSDKKEALLDEPPFNQEAAE
jgi:DNA recombination protein Rad52